MTHEVITSLQNPQVKMLRTLNRGRAERLANGLYLAEGEHMAAEAVKEKKANVLLLDSSALDKYSAFIDEAALPVYVLSPHVMAAVCDAKTPQGIAALCDYPQEESLSALGERIIVLDGVQDPGNVGTIWRTADAAGFQALLLGAGSADPLSPQVQRSAMGSGFRVPYAHSEDLAQTLIALRKRGWHVIASDLSGADFYAREELGERFVLVIGNEARGISDAVREAADCRVKLPMRGGAESLNAAVAAGIMMYELMRGK